MKIKALLLPYSLITLIAFAQPVFAQGDGNRTWEYAVQNRRVDLSPAGLSGEVEFLNGEGRKGWELVSVYAETVRPPGNPPFMGRFYYFKRAKQ